MIPFEASIWAFIAVTAAEETKGLNKNITRLQQTYHPQKVQRGLQLLIEDRLKERLYFKGFAAHLHFFR